MIPIIYDEYATDFTVGGLPLAQTVSCIVTEELNGEFELSLTYPCDGQYLDQLQIRNIIYAIPSPYRKPQAFRIYQIDKGIGDKNMSIKARHISYDLSSVFFSGGVVGSANLMMQHIKSNSYPADDEWIDPVTGKEVPINHIAKQFDLYSNIKTEQECIWAKPISIKNVLGGVENSILDTWHGEYIFDNWNISLLKKRGITRSFTIRYGFNMIKCDVSIDNDRKVTGEIPYWYGKLGEDIPEQLICPRDEHDRPEVVYQDGETSNDYIISQDYSSDFEEPPTVDQLIAKAKNHLQNYTSKDTDITIEADYASLKQTIDYMDINIDEEFDLGDTIQVDCQPLNLNVSARVKKIETDVLAERYTSANIGTLKRTLTDTLRNVIYGY